MQTLTTGTGAFLTMLAAISTTTFAHDGHNHSHGGDQRITLPETNQQPGEVTNEAPPFGTLPPGHTPNDGHDHGNTNNQLPQQPTRVPSRVNPRTDSNPFYSSPNRFLPNTGDGIGRFDRAPTPEFAPRQQDNWGRPNAPYSGVPSPFGRGLPYNESGIGHGCLSGSCCPLSGGSSQQSIPFQYSGYEDSPLAIQRWNADQCQPPANYDCDRCRNYHSCPLNH